MYGAQHPGGADGEALHHPSCVVQSLALEVVLEMQRLKQVRRCQEHHGEEHGCVHQGQVTDSQAAGLRPAILAECEDVEEEEEGVGCDSNASLGEKGIFK